MSRLANHFLDFDFEPAPMFKFSRPRYFRCCTCGDLCEPVEVDEGNYEEYWGATVWRPDVQLYSDCCGDDVEELRENPEH